MPCWKGRPLGVWEPKQNNPPRRRAHLYVAPYLYPSSEALLLLLLMLLLPLIVGFERLPVSSYDPRQPLQPLPITTPSTQQPRKRDTETVSDGYSARQVGTAGPRRWCCRSPFPPFRPRLSRLFFQVVLSGSLQVAVLSGRSQISI
ncbi:hypothetical protein NKR23_g4068 [Pleurostoma richardsiae]|uniref:Uncharacterized protein n=1 Tax=Pleurostoma richardsiae TaxID=41990 RepID=A0AA38RSJ1_9PEZI|nr:hypothetical protein NKR23_g4068 [Pleurostoma richardsiae]